MQSFPWGDQRRFHTFSAWCQREFGSRLQKLSINAGFTCPNRDGSLGTGGCTFCNNEAFNPSYCTPAKSITRQIDEGIEFHKNRYRRANKYLAYFQAYSNTYKELDELKKLYQEALSHPMISGLSIGTRPDCISDELLDYLEGLSKEHFISLEYGIESCYDRTLKLINRGHDFECAAEAIRQTAARGIFTTGHLVFGLPGETLEEMLAQADILSALPLHSIKLHQLQILEGTVMAEQFRKDPSDFTIFTLENYIALVISFLEGLRPDMIIERLSGEVPPRFLINSPWEKLRADQVLQRIEKNMKETNTWQGRLYKADRSFTN
ncbi:MAG: TIGR01212 family radical SAM protein [Bacteroidota bacterium]